MTLQRALINQMRPNLIMAHAREIIAIEGGKGSCTDLCDQPVALEPYFQSIPERTDFSFTREDAIYRLEPPPPYEDLVRAKVWIPANGEFSWINAERFLKQLRSVTHRVGIEIIGNQEDVNLFILCHKTDLNVIQVLFQGEYPGYQFSPGVISPLDPLSLNRWSSYVLRDYYPLPPYSHLFTRPDEIVDTPFTPLFIALSRIPKPSLGIYQILFSPVADDHNWVRNIEILRDMEFTNKLVIGPGSQQRYQQQIPSGDLPGMARSVDTKAHRDKPIFAASCRLAVVGSSPPEAESLLRGLGTCTDLILHEGRPLNWITEKEYSQVLPPDGIKSLFVQGLVHRAGFLLNSLELVCFAHFPIIREEQSQNLPIEILSPLTPPSEDLSTGTLIGTMSYAGQVHPIHIPHKVRRCHTHLIGIPQKGKSTCEENIALGDIEAGDGIAFIDPHGDSARRLASLIPEKRIEDTIYFDPGDPEWIPLWNPIKPRNYQSITRIADDVLRTLKNITTGWGDRLEHLLRLGLIGILHLEAPTLGALSEVLTPACPNRNQIRRQVLERIQGTHLRKFWEEQIDSYSEADLAPVAHKLSKLLSFGTVDEMLSQPENKIDFWSIMNEGKIFIADLSTVGSDMRDLLGSLILSQLYHAALSRSEIPEEKRRVFNIIADEAQRFMPNSIEDLIAETRKYQVSLTFAHQYFSQFENQQVADALGIVGTTICFGSLHKDAERLRKTLLCKVEVSDLLDLDTGEAFARIGTEVVRLDTLKPRTITDPSIRERVLDLTHQKYCRRRTESGGQDSESRSGQSGHPRQSTKNQGVKVLFDSL